MKDKKVFKAVLEALVSADIQVRYKMIQNVEMSKSERLTEGLKNNLVNSFEHINTVSILYHNGRRSVLF